MGEKFDFKSDKCLIDFVEPVEFKKLRNRKVVNISTEDVVLPLTPDHEVFSITPDNTVKRSQAKEKLEDGFSFLVAANYLRKKYMSLFSTKIIAFYSLSEYDRDNKSWSIEIPENFRRISRIGVRIITLNSKRRKLL
ncbi:MAG: hypothetical protein HC904_17305 [Blastochloris sp.]|nr:hypothetical protein [Blastochloris sp.]